MRPPFTQIRILIDALLRCVAELEHKRMPLGLLVGRQNLDELVDGGGELELAGAADVQEGGNDLGRQAVHQL